MFLLTHISYSLKLLMERNKLRQSLGQSPGVNRKVCSYTPLNFVCYPLVSGLAFEHAVTRAAIRKKKNSLACDTSPTAHIKAV